MQTLTRRSVGDAAVGLGLQFLHMPEGPFSYDAGHILIHILLRKPIFTRYKIYIALHLDNVRLANIRSPDSLCLQYALAPYFDFVTTAAEEYTRCVGCRIEPPTAKRGYRGIHVKAVAVGQNLWINAL